MLNEAVSDLVNAHARLDISQAWGDGTAVAADGTLMDTYLDSLLSETSVRYGKPGGIAYHHVSDTYIALFTHFIPCGVWEAVYMWAEAMDYVQGADFFPEASGFGG
ncbi:Tn3 family transposase [Streptomyces afghaniensis]|nr:Tn3 family transposase [Streptomyces afghaniensis]